MNNLKLNEENTNLTKFFFENSSNNKVTPPNENMKINIEQTPVFSEIPFPPLIKNPEKSELFISFYKQLSRYPEILKLKEFQQHMVLLKEKYPHLYHSIVNCL